MKIQICLFFLLLITSCSDKKETKNESTVKEKKMRTTVNVVEKKTNEMDCVFDNKPKDLTDEWLKEVGVEKFYWDEKEKHAVMIDGQDTLFVFKGGCNHLTESVEIRTGTSDDDIFNSMQLQIIDEIACKFGFANYCGKLANKQFEKITIKEDTFLLEFKDDDPDDNLILEGIQLVKVKKHLRISISQYYN